MALDNKRSVYEIAIEIGGKLKQSLGTATSGANKKLSGLAVYADKTARATTSLSKAINGMMLLKGASWVGEHMISIGKSAISAASEMETYRTTLNTVLRDEEKAADMMRWSTEFAAHTPYNTGDIVDAVTRLEAYGFKSQAMLENIGNMASAMNKDLPTAVEAVYKATLGEMELMENNFAITKKLINEKAQEWYGQAVIDASKKITDTEMYTNTLLRLIEEKFEGGMEAQSRTWAGIKSNMEDSRDAIFRRIVGMDAAGEATEDGLYARMLRMGQRAADGLSAFADSDVLDEWAGKLGGVWDQAEKAASDWMQNDGKEVIQWIKDTVGLTEELRQKIQEISVSTPGENWSYLTDTVKYIGEGIQNMLRVGNGLGAVLSGDFKTAWEYFKGFGVNVGEQIIEQIPMLNRYYEDLKKPENERELSNLRIDPIRGGFRSDSYNYSITITANSAEGNASGLADVIADRVKTAIKETEHQNLRTRFRVKE